MSNGAQDWFSQNAPKAGAQGGDWFAANAPAGRPEGSPDPEKELASPPRPNVKGSLGIMEAIRHSQVPGLRDREKISPYTKGGEETAATAKRYQEYEKESGATIGATAGAMALAPVVSAGTIGLPWLTRLISKASGVGVGSGGGAFVGGASPKEALVTGAITTALTPVFEAVGVVPGKLKEFGGSKLSPKMETKLPVEAEEFPAKAVTQKEVLEHAAQSGIKLTKGQATGAPVARYAQALGERSIFGANQLAEAMEENAGKFVKSVREFADRVDPKAMGLSEEQAGETIQQSAGKAKEVTHENASNAYKQLEWANKTPIETTPLTKKWMQLRGGLPLGVEEQILAQVPRDQLALVDELIHPSGMKPPMTFEQGIQLRSIFRELGDTEGLPDRVQASFREMAKTTDSAMESSATKAGFEKEWRTANAGWKEYAQLYGDPQSPLYKILRTKDPAQITRQLLNRASARDVEIMQGQHMGGALEAMKRQVIKDVGMQKFRVTKDGLGGYSDSFLRKLFGNDLKELYLKANIGRRFQWQENPSGTSQVLLAAKQFEEPKLTSSMWGAAKYSMPRDPLSFLSSQLRGRFMPKALPAVPGAARSGE